MSLVKIQSELKAPKSQRNNFGKYNYRNCEDILEAVKPILLKYDAELTISDEIKQAGDYTYVESCAVITIGEKSYSTTAQAGIEKAGGMQLPQAFGSAGSYARKYALNGLLLIDDTKDADATNKHDTGHSKPSQTPKKKAPEPEGWATILKDILPGLKPKDWDDFLENYPDGVKALRAEFVKRKNSKG